MHFVFKLCNKCFKVFYVCFKRVHIFVCVCVCVCVSVGIKLVLLHQAWVVLFMSSISFFLNF